MPEITYRALINKNLKEIMHRHNEIILLGQSIRDPYGGACKVTRGLTKEFPDKIIDTPISEHSTMGIAIGLSMSGNLPIVEIMFSDFLTLCVDQIVNVQKVISEYHCDISIIIRTMDQAGILYGPTHSKNMEWLMSALGLKVYDVKELKTLDKWEEILLNKGITVILEHKPLYEEKIYE